MGGRNKWQDFHFPTPGLSTPASGLQAADHPKSWPRFLRTYAVYFPKPYLPFRLYTRTHVQGEKLKEQQGAWTCRLLIVFNLALKPKADVHTAWTMNFPFRSFSYEASTVRRRIRSLQGGVRVMSWRLVISRGRFPGRRGYKRWQRWHTTRAPWSAHR